MTSSNNAPASDLALNDLFIKASIDPAKVVVFRHRPTEPRLRQALPWLAAERPELYNAYQQTHGQRVENALAGMSYVASFIGHEPGRAVFVGLYEVGASKPLTSAEYWKVPAYAELKKLGMKGFTEEEGRSSCLWYDLTLTDFYAAWKGRLIVAWPPPERSWWRRAHRNILSVVALPEDSLLVKPVDDWRVLDLT